MGPCLSSAAYEKWHKKVNRKHTDLGEYGKPTVLSASDYAFGPFIAEGGMGTVYAGICVSDRKFVALKFFGYTDKEPRDSDIDREISLLMAVSGVEGVVQIKGVFMDSKSGQVGSSGEKKWLNEYPVIVMEYLDGGAICDVMHERKKISETDLKGIFSRFIVALHGMHSRGYIHNDLKLENVMLESQTDDSVVKIIDLGFMNYLPPGTKKVTGKGLKGTPGYIAPETHSQYEYSYKTDMWQAGCLLYSMLSGIGAFSSKDVPQTMRGEFFPMTGPFHFSTR
jgi:serine/threonine protein kinase